MAFGWLQGTPTPSAGPSQQTLPQTQAFPAKPSLKQLICRSEWSQGPTIRCKFAVQAPLSRKTTTLPHFFLLPPKYPARLSFIVAACRSKLKTLPSYRPISKPSYTSPHQWISFPENKKLLSISRSLQGNSYSQIFLLIPFQGVDRWQSIAPKWKFIFNLKWPNMIRNIIYARDILVPSE